MDSVPRQLLMIAKRNDYYYQSGSLVLYLLIFIRFAFYGPFTLAIFAAISAAISSAILRRFQIARVNYWRFRGDLNRPLALTSQNQ